MYLLDAVLSRDECIHAFGSVPLGKQHGKGEGALTVRPACDLEKSHQDLSTKCPVGVGTPCKFLRTLAHDFVPLDREHLLVDVVGKDQGVERKDALEPRWHLLGEDILVRSPRDPKEGDGNPRTKDVVEVPEKILECYVVGGQDESRHAVKLPEQQRGGAPRASMQHALPDCANPKHGDGEHEDE